MADGLLHRLVFACGQWAKNPSLRVAGRFDVGVCVPFLVAAYNQIKH